MSLDLQMPALQAMPPIDLRLLNRLRGTAQRLMRHRWPIEVIGAENLPDGAAVLATNHLNNLDGPMVVALTPDTLALAKIELFNGPLGWLLDHVGQIAIDRQHSDPWAIKRCLQVLQTGRRLAIFPEAHRGPGDFRDFRPGAAYLAMVSGAPVVPVALLGTRDPDGSRSAPPRRGARICVVYGEPVPVQQVPWPRRPDAVAAEAHRLQEICRAHVVAAQQLTDLTLPSWTP